MKCKIQVSGNEKPISNILVIKGVEQQATSQDQVVTQTQLQPQPSLQQYGTDIPQALLHLLELLTQATTIQPPADKSTPQPKGADNGEPSIPTPVDTTRTEVSAPTMVNPTTPSFPVNIAPTGQT